MLLKATGRCVRECGVGVEGEVETASREFVYRLTFPPGAENLVQRPRTEVESFLLATFGPDEKDWGVECPLCRGRILVAKGNV